MVCRVYARSIEAIRVVVPEIGLNRFKLADIEGKQPDGVIAGATDVADEGDDDFCAPMPRYSVRKYFITDVLFTKDNVMNHRTEVGFLDPDTRCDNMRIEKTVVAYSLNVRKAVKAVNQERTLQVTNKSSRRNRQQHKDTRILLSLVGQEALLTGRKRV